MGERWVGPAEMAALLGVSAKALRVYERAGLVAPLRSEAGWRMYGPPQAARLHQILALKRLGLPLRRIGELLSGRLTSLDSVLALQEAVLRERLQDAEAALALLRAARGKLGRDGSLSLDDLGELTRRLDMTEKLAASDAIETALRPLIDKHYTAEEKAEIGASKQAALAQAGYDEAGFSKAWNEMFEEARVLMAAGDAESARACSLARRWMEMVSHFTQGDTERKRKAQAVWGEALADPEVSRQLPVGADVFAFVRRIVEEMRSRGEAGVG